MRVIDGVTEIMDGGGLHSMVLGQDGNVFATGGNAHGQLGDGSIESKNAYARVFFSVRSTLLSRAGTLVVHNNYRLHS